MASPAGPQKVPQQQSCNQGSSPAAPLGSSQDEGDPGMRMKMCKKIAQLTKVIYALNTKNDEHEASIQALKEAHQEEIQYILAETRETVLQYKSKLEEAQELQKYIHTLEEALEKHRRITKEAPSEFATCAKLTEERQPPVETKQAEEKILLPQVMVHMKLDLENTDQASNKESDILMSNHKALAGDQLDNRGKLTEIYSIDMQAAMSETVNFKWENEKLTEVYPEKATQLQASHEKEKETWRKAMQQSVADSCREWQQKKMEQRKIYEARESVSRQQLEKLEADLEAKGQKISELKKYSQKLKEKMQEVQIQLEELKKKYENEIRQLQKEKEAVNGKLQDCSLEALRLETFIRQNRDIPKCAEFLKSHARKSRERQQELHDALVQQKDISKHQKERGKGREHPPVPTSSRNEEKPRLDSGGTPKREDRQTLASFQKEKSKEIQALQEEWYYQKTELQAQVTELKKTLEQQANAFREALKQQELQSSREKEKLLQDLQDTIKHSQDTKAQLEASHQRAINLLEKSKNQEFKEAEEYWKKECNDRFKLQQQSHHLEVQALEEKAREKLQTEVESIQNQQTLLIDSLKLELSEQQLSYMTHSKEKEELQVELKNVVAAKRHQDLNYQNQIKSLNDELEKCQNEISGLKKENSVLKDTMDLLTVDVELQKQTSAQLQDRENQQRRLLEEDLKIKHKKELDILKESHHKELQNVISEFSNSQALLHAKILSLENELKELEEKPRKREPRLEDLQHIGCLQDKLHEKEEMIKELMDGRNLRHSLIPSAEPHRNRSFSFNTNPTTCLTPIAKQKKKMDEAPSRIVSVPNLASYAKSFLTGDLRPKRNPPQITKSTSLDQNPGCVRVCYPSVQVLEIKPATRLQNTETSNLKDAEKPDPGHQEWFTKYFSF
ncbi:protein FAM184B [Sceloporus undulatus]|uniref:protein FAM184B n=1 Tax=Sceloporus undulatus TaxID=8520 RepID=UPI001C4AB8BA|nr:protein FAM184B [Sceloporus undulatus]